MAEETVVVKIDEAKAATAKALQKIGWDEEDAALQAEIRTSAEICGNNQGLVKLLNPVLMKPAEGCSKPTIERDTPSSAVVNGNQSPGMLAASMAADLAVKKVQAGVTISIVSAYNTSTSSGQLGHYAGKMAEQEVVGIVMANSPEFVAATKGANPVVGTNPMAFGIPKADGSPVIFDMSTSAIALFGVMTAKAKGEALPEGVACDNDGEYTTDASSVLDGGSIQTFGGHKGAGLSLMVELLAGALSGGAVLGQVESKKTAKSWGHTVIAIKPGMLTDGFEEKAASICGTVKASGDNVRLPGESSSSIQKQRISEGELPVPKKIWDMIQKTAAEGLP
mmetsp:Transcript_137171/g.273690  ORF Transcript_137171/g.273690 Transcript_137171/m.273690 type:complete len:337 (+) Transcript_137171:90-1100(+)